MEHVEKPATGSGNDVEKPAALLGSSAAGFAVGDSVEVFGLVSKAGAALNGRIGQIIGRSFATGRWQMKFRGIADGKQIKECNMRIVHPKGGPACPSVRSSTSARASQSPEGPEVESVNTTADSRGLLSQFLHYAFPFMASSREKHGWEQLRSANTLCYVGCTVIYCESQDVANALNAKMAKMERESWSKRDGAPRCAAIADGREVPFERSRVITLINFGLPASLAEYQRRVQQAFSISADWPKSEPRGLVVNLVASSLSQPYTALNMDSRWIGSTTADVEPCAWVSVFREDHPESLHAPVVNTFEMPEEYKLLERGGISFKPWGDEAEAGANIEEWHLILGHRKGNRHYFYNLQWSWTGTPPDPFAENPTMTSRRLDAIMDVGKLPIPSHLSASEVLALVRRHR